MKKIINILDAVAYTAGAMFAVVALGAMIQGFMMQNVRLLDFGCFAAWGAVSPYVWIKLSNNPAVEASAVGFCFAAFYSLGVGSSACVNLASFVWIAAPMLTGAVAPLDMSRFYLFGPMSIVYFVFVWHFMHTTVLRIKNPPPTK